MEENYSPIGRRDFYQLMADKRDEIKGLGFSAEKERELLGLLGKTIERYEANRKNHWESLIELGRLEDAERRYNQAVPQLEATQERALASSVGLAQEVIGLFFPKKKPALH